jgi:tetratricopeptide (TPR) repeat protein
MLAQSKPDQGAEDLVKALSGFPDDRIVGAARDPIDMLVVSSDQAFDRAVALRPLDQQIWVARGRFLAWQSRWKEAALAYERGVRARPFFHDSLEYACVLVLSGDFDGYRQLCKSLNEKPPGSDGQNDIGPGLVWQLAEAARVGSLHPDSGAGPKRMLEWCERSLRDKPEHASILFAAALVRYRIRDEATAISLLGRTATSDLPFEWNGWAMIRYLLALSHHRLGHNYDARRWYDLAESSLAARDKRAAKQATPPLD